MSPEILNQEHYKKPSDIYSFSITMYEVIVWREAYPKTRFKHPWDIASFVQQGKRISLECISNKTIKEIIDNSWKQNPYERMNITSIISKLESIE